MTTQHTQAENIETGLNIYNHKKWQMYRQEISLAVLPKLIHILLIKVIRNGLI